LVTPEANGPVSNIATAVANAAGQLSSLPVIGRFATAFQIAGTGVASIARLFGFSYPNVLHVTRVVRSVGDPYSLSAGESSVVKLSTDPLNNTSIDPSVVGDVSDYMSISNIIRTPGYLGKFTLQQTDTIGDTLLAVTVFPSFGSDTGSGKSYNPAVTAYASMFRNWRGSLRYRVVFL